MTSAAPRILDIDIDADKSVIYAIGDVHGEALKLRGLLAAIDEHHNHAMPHLEKIIVFLGDYVDRGPDSRTVLDIVRSYAPNSGNGCYALRGNHEQMMIDAFRSGRHGDPLFWMRNGGDATMESFSDTGDDTIPSDYLDWLGSLPTLLKDGRNKRLLVHAGVDPKKWPETSDELHMWSRLSRLGETRDWAGTGLEGYTIIHGHTVTKDGEPDHFRSEFGTRINVDTGAVFGAPLTAAVLHGTTVGFLQTATNIAPAPP